MWRSCPWNITRRRGGAVEEVRDFCYLGELLETDSGAGRAIRMRISSAWSKWREISSLLNNRHIPLVHRGRVYDACIRPVLIYGSETRGMTWALEQRMVSCDRRMLRYMAGLTLRDMVRSEEIARRCELDCDGTGTSGAERRMSLWLESKHWRHLEEDLQVGQRKPG